MNSLQTSYKYITSLLVSTLQYTTVQKSHGKDGNDYSTKRFAIFTHFTP
jgi:hypothetical protein